MILKLRAWATADSIKCLRQSYLDTDLALRYLVQRLTARCTNCPRWLPFRSMLVRYWSRGIARAEALHRKLLPQFLEMNGQLERELECLKKKIHHRQMRKLAAPMTT